MSESEFPQQNVWESRQVRHKLWQLALTLYGDYWWMRLRRDTLRVEESAFFPGRLSLHRLSAKRWRALRNVGIGTARKSVRDKR
jgi:hypothetical protein